MRILLLLAWLLLPVGVGIWHYGPGQDQMRLDEVSKLLAAADAALQAEKFSDAVNLYEDALQRLPSERVQESRQIRLAKAKAQMRASQLPQAHTDLKALVDELQNVPGSEKLLADARSSLAQACYYTTWMLRLEGASPDEWEPEIEEARQLYRLLAEDAKANGDCAAATKAQEDLELAIRLSRMELSELQGQPLPCQCSGCCSCKKPGRGKKPGKMGKTPQDARGASSGPPPDKSGH